MSFVVKVGVCVFQYQRIDIVAADSGDTFVLSQDVIVPANQIGVDHELVLITEHSPALIEYCHVSPAHPATAMAIAL